MKDDDEKDSLGPAIVSYSFMLLVVVGTIIGFFNIGFSAGVVVGFLFALVVVWIFSIMILSSIYPDWSDNKTCFVGLAIALFIVINLTFIGLSK